MGGAGPGFPAPTWASAQVREGVCAGGALTTALCSTRAFTSSTFPEITLGRMEESAPLQNRKMSPVLPQKGVGGRGGVSRPENLIHSQSCEFCFFTGGGSDDDAHPPPDRVERQNLQQLEPETTRKVHLLF